MPLLGNDVLGRTYPIVKPWYMEVLTYQYEFIIYWFDLQYIVLGIQTALRDWSELQGYIFQVLMYW